MSLYPSRGNLCHGHITLSWISFEYYCMLHTASPGSIAQLMYDDNFQRMVTNVLQLYYLFFSLNSTTAFFLPIWNFDVNSLFYQKADSCHFCQWARVMPKQEKTRNAMLRKNHDDLDNCNLLRGLFRTIRGANNGLFGKIAVSWLLFHSKTPS